MKNKLSFIVAISLLITIGCKHNKLLDRTLRYSVSREIETKFLVVTTGQSNMLGVYTDGALPIVPHMYMYNYDGNLRPAQDSMTDPKFGTISAFTSDSANGAGPGRFFAKCLLDYFPKTEVTLVPTGRGATSITEWQPGQPLYQALVSQTKAAEQKTGLKTNVLLYWQGEADDNPIENVQAWAGRFKSFVSAYRADIGNPDLPVIFVQIGDINNSQRTQLREEMANVHISNCVMIKTDGVPQNANHYFVSGYEEMGRRFFDAYLNNFANQ